MNRILVLLVTFSLGFNTAYSQKSLNDYKYVIVPTKYDFLNKEDSFQLNSLTKFLFNKHGFKAFMGDETLPEDLQTNNCLALRANVDKGRGIFTTKLFVELKDCYNTTVFKTDMGESRKKDFKTAYNLALRDAFKYLQAANYKYNGSVSSAKTSQPQTSKPASQVVETPIKEIKKEAKKIAAPKVTVSKPETKMKPSVPESKPVEPNTQKPVKKVPVNTDVLYAQPTKGGFQLVDSTPKVVYKIAYSGAIDVFIVLGKDAIIHKVNGVWAISEIDGNKLLTKTLNIKF